MDADISDPAVEAITVAELVAIGREAVDRLQPLADGILAGAGAGRATATIRIGNSHGLRSSCRRSSWSFYALAQRVEGTSVLWCHDGGASMHRDIDVDAAIEGAAEKVRRSLKEGRLPTGSRPVVFTPAALSANPRRPPQRGQRSGRLPQDLAADRPAGRAGPEQQGHDPRRQPAQAGRAGSPFDDEGLPAFQMPIVEEGVLKNFVADLRFAARLDLRPGRGRRAGYATGPFPAAGNWEMAGGTLPLG